MSRRHAESWPKCMPIWPLNKKAISSWDVGNVSFARATVVGLESCSGLADLALCLNC